MKISSTIRINVPPISAHHTAAVRVNGTAFRGTRVVACSTGLGVGSAAGGRAGSTTCGGSGSGGTDGGLLVITSSLPVQTEKQAPRGLGSENRPRGNRDADGQAALGHSRSRSSRPPGRRLRQRQSAWRRRGVG